MTFDLSTAPFSSSSLWNTPVNAGATYTKLNWPTPTGYNYGAAWDSYSPAVYVASASDPVVQVSVPDSWGHPAGTISVHIPAGVTGANGTDGELVVIDGDMAYNFWQFNRTSTTTATVGAWGDSSVTTGTGWGTSSPFLGAGTMATGTSELGGLLVQAQTNTGTINHAIALVVDAPLVKPGAVGGAIASDGGSSTGIVQEGQLLAIPPGTPMPAGLDQLGQEVFRAMQQYGAYVADVASGTTNVRMQANGYSAAINNTLWAEMGKITPLLQAVTGGTPVSGGTTSSGGSTGSGGTTSSGGSTGSSGSGSTSGPTIPWISASAPGITNGNGNLSSGTVQLNLNFSAPVNVTGTPSLTLNDGGTATYASGSGTNNLVFNYPIAAGQNTPSLMVSAYNSFSGVKDAAGNSVNLTGAPTWVTNGTIAIDTTAPTVSSIAASGSGITNGTGNLSSGTVQLAAGFSENVNVTGTPTLTLNDGGTATYASGSGTKNLVFNYTIAPGQSTADLAVNSYNLGGVHDLAGNSVSLTGAPTNPAGTLAIGSGGTTGSGGSTTPPTNTAPTVTGVTAQPATGVEHVGDKVNLTAAFSEAVTVNGQPTMTLNDGSTATYVSGSGTSNLVFSDTVGSSDKSVSALGVTSLNLPNGATIKDSGGLAADVSGAVTTFSGLSVDTSSSTTSGGGTTPPPVTTPTAPVLTVADNSLHVNAGRSVDLGISVSIPNAGDNVTVDIKGLPGYETITDTLDGKTFSGSDITLNAAQVNSGLKLTSNYKGHGAPSSTLTVTATDNTGTPVTSAAQSIVVKDPPLTTTFGKTSRGASHRHSTDGGAVADPTGGSGSGTVTNPTGISGSPGSVSSGSGPAQAQRPGQSGSSPHFDLSYWLDSHPDFVNAANTLSDKFASKSGTSAAPGSSSAATASAGYKAFALFNQSMAGDFGNASQFAQSGSSSAQTQTSQANTPSTSPQGSSSAISGTTSTQLAGLFAMSSLDLANLAFDGKAKLSYSPNADNSGGTLTVSDGAMSAKLALLGQYTAASFATSADTSGGTLIQAVPTADVALAKPKLA